LEDVFFRRRVVVGPASTTPTGPIVQPCQHELRVRRFILGWHAETGTVEPVAKPSAPLRVQNRRSESCHKDCATDPPSPQFHRDRILSDFAAGFNKTELNVFYGKFERTFKV